MAMVFRKAFWWALLLVAVGLNDAAASELEAHHPGTAPGVAAALSQSEESAATMPGMMEVMGKNKMMAEMMGRGAGRMETRTCLDPAAPSAKLHMMEGVLSGRMMMDPGMMRQMMDREFFLDRAEELGLSVEQVSKLTAIRNACRKDNIRAGAELRILRLDLDELLSRTGWSLPEAEKLIRKQQAQQGDMLVRHLQAVADARKVLSAEQLKKADAAGREAGLKGLFE